MFFLWTPLHFFSFKIVSFGSELYIVHILIIEIESRKRKSIKKNERKLLVIQISTKKKVDIVDNGFHLMKVMLLMYFLFSILSKEVDRDSIFFLIQGDFSVF